MFYGNVFFSLPSIKMSFNKKSLSLSGDIAHRDVFQRKKVQVNKQGDIENYFVHVNAANVVVDTLLERASLDGAGSSRYEVFTKPGTGNLSTSANTATVEVTTGRVTIRSLLFEASGNAAVGGTMGIAGRSTLSTLATSGPATPNAATVTGQTSLSNTTVALENSGALNVSGNGNVNVGTMVCLLRLDLSPLDLALS